MILLASPSPQLLTRWSAGAAGNMPVVCVAEIAALRKELSRLRPQILLLDHDLPGAEDAQGLAALMQASPATRIVVLAHPLSEDAEWRLFKAGVRGCCAKTIEAELLGRVVAAVGQGELWMRRSLTHRLLRELGDIALKKDQIKQAASNLLANLTRREQEIATLVGHGESNKEIARRLDITERTVKAHLTEIFRKLNVADRLKLALLVTGSAGVPE